MRLTIDLPAYLAERLERRMEQLPEIIRRGLGEKSHDHTLMEEVFEFLARRPSAEEVVAYEPPASCSARLRELLARNREGELTAEEEAELDTFESLNHLFALVKAQARQRLQSAA